MEQTGSTKSGFLLSVIAIIIAAVGAFYHPLVDLFRGPKYVVSYGKDLLIQVDNQCYVNYYVYANIRNIGGEEGNISNIELHITNKVDSSMTTKLYSMDKGSLDIRDGLNQVIYFPFTGLTLLPGEKWEGYISFSQPLNPKERVVHDVLYKKVQSYYDGNKAKNVAFDDSGRELYKLPDNLYQELKDVYIQRIGSFGVGHYQGLIVYKTDEGVVPMSQSLEFSIYESDYNRMVDELLTEDLKYGLHFAFINNVNRGVYIPITFLK